MEINSSSRIFISGGSGSFGQAFIRRVLSRFPEIKRIVIFSRDEYKQWKMMDKFPPSKYPQLRFFIGDIRDIDRLNTAMEGIDIVIHAAALKHVPAAEYNPIEFVKTNVIGTENMIQASLKNGVKKFIALSTDKAAAPINLYGATKLCSDKLTIAANNIKGSKNIKFAVVRYGNVLGSRGSVIPHFLDKAKEGNIPITDKNMTRFNITLDQSVEMVIWAVENTFGGEIFVPKLPSYRIIDVADAIGPNCNKSFAGVRPGEKIHEEMITTSDSLNTIELENYFAILPSDGLIKEKYNNSRVSFNALPEMFSYNSGQNTKFLTIDEIRNLILNHVDKNFKPN